MKQTGFYKSIAAAAAAALSLLQTGVPAAADGEPQAYIASGDCGAEEGNLTWTLDSAGTLTFSGAGDMKDWQLSQITHKSTAPYAAYLQDIRSVVFEDGVTGIGMYACAGCTALTEITIPESVTAIAACAFEGCTSLAEITVPESVTDIGQNAFSGTPWMENRLAESPFLIVNRNLLSVRTDQPDITVPDGITKIGASAFSGCSQTVKHVTLPEGLTAIGAAAFYQCRELETVSLPETVKSIGSSAFRSCTNLQDIRIPEGVESIAAAAFADCDQLESIDLPASVKSIGADAFSCCKSLARIIIRNPDCAIQENFANGATISNGYERVTGAANRYFFNGTIYSYGGAAVEAYAETYGRDFFDLGAKPVASGACGAAGDNVTWSLDSQGILTITGTGNMGDYEDAPPYADYLDAIRKAEIADGVTGIGTRAFYGCKNLSRMIIPESVTSFGKDAFTGTAWLEDRLNESLLLIINRVLVCARTTAYDVTVPDGVTRIEVFACSGNRNLTSLTVPASVKSIGQEAFSACPNLNTVNLPKQLKEIGAGAFSQCTALREISIPAGVTEIKDRTFFRCSSLEQITLPENIAAIGAEAFAACGQLSAVTILNPDCVIYDETAGAATISNRTESAADGETEYIFDGTICSKGGAAVEAYAKKYGRRFTDISSPPTAEKTGDVNCDGMVDVSDAVILARLLAEDPNVVVKQTGMKNADVNSSGLPDSEDVVMILRAIARLITL